MPQPPTDNLYKFSAIAGLVLFIFSLFVAYSLDMEYAKSAGPLLAELKQFNAEIALPDDLATKAPEAERERRIRRARLESLVETQVSIKKGVRIIGIYDGIGAGVSLSMMFWGFYCWRTRVQVYEDAILRAKARDCGFDPDAQTESAKQERTEAVIPNSASTQTATSDSQVIGSAAKPTEQPQA